MKEDKKEKYINPFTDFGFKRLFGEDMNKDLLLDFLNELLKEKQGQITDLTYVKTEQLGRTEEERKAIFDIYCENEKGEKFLVEMQKTKQAFFKDRTVYYSTFPIQEQAKRSDWDYSLKAVYTIAILDFVFDEDKKKEEADKFRYEIQLSDVETNTVFFDKLTFIYLEMPKFSKKEEEIETKFEKWLYVLKNLHKLDRLPEKLQEEIFERVFEVAEISKFTQEEHRSYENSLKSYRDLQNSLAKARAEGEEKGMDLKTVSVVLKMRSKGFSNDEIADVVELTVEQVIAIIEKEW